MIDIIAADYGIRQLLARFTDSVWRQDAPCFADCFIADGVWKIAGMEMVGRAALIEGCGTLLGQHERVQLLSGQPMLKVEGDAVVGRLQVTELAKRKNGTSALTLGTYHDRYVEQGGIWRFARRHWSMAYHGPVDMSAAYAPQPDYGVFPAGPGRDEPTYIRPVV